MHNTLQSMLQMQGHVVIDGALATELEARGADLNDPLWSARVLIESPELIRQVHYDYFVAGADIAITASYQATYPGLAARGLDATAAHKVLQRSVEIAQAARADFWATPDREPTRAYPLVAASIGPYGAYLADGSEYRGNYGLSRSQLVEFHRRRMETLLAAQPDLLACETIPCVEEARALVELLEAQPAPPAAWISFACRNATELNSGEPFAAAVQAVAHARPVVAIGINCTAPQYVADLLAVARNATRKPLLAYPNRGEKWDAAARCWIPDPHAPELAAYIEQWRAAGAAGVGGCCRTNPHDIRAVAAVLAPTSRGA